MTGHRRASHFWQAVGREARTDITRLYRGPFLHDWLLVRPHFLKFPEPPIQSAGD